MKTPGENEDVDGVFVYQLAESAIVNSIRNGCFDEIYGGGGPW
jgi:hypothetical protein